MKITSLGQAGLLIEDNGSIILVDPYLSNNVEKFEPQNKRRLPIDESVFLVKPDCLIFTHCHLDHYDIETINKFKDIKNVITFSPISVYNDIKIRYPNFTNKLVTIGDKLKLYNFNITVLKSFHSDKEAVGFLIENNDKIIYIVGDSLYKVELIDNFPKHCAPDYLFVPVNGYGNNMNDVEANELAIKINAKVVIPYHYGMFDDLKFEDFKIKNKKELRIYQSLEID